MKRMLNFLIIAVILLSIPSMSHSKWKHSKDVNMHGQMGRVNIVLASYEIDLSDDVIAPGWSDSKMVDVTNTGTMPVNLTGTVNDAPTFMTVVLDVPVGVVYPGGVATVTITCSIPEDLDQSFEDADVGFSVTIQGEQL